MDRPLQMNRREAALTFGALWTALAVPTGALAQTQSLTWTPKALTPDQARVLEVVAELIMPRTDTPGAREAGVPAFVDRAVATFSAPSEAAAIRAGLDHIDAIARATHGRDFAALTPAQQTAQLAAYETPQAAAPAPVGGRGDTETGLTNPIARPSAMFFPLLKDLVTVGYFTSELGATRAVRYDPVPGAYRGCVPLSEIGRAWAQ
jgi:gluconate 2-dehydrogenase gamma chain